MDSFLWFSKTLNTDRSRSTKTCFVEDKVMKQLIYFIIVGAVFGLGFYAGTEKTLGVLRNDNPHDAQVSKLPKRNSMFEMAQNAKDDVFAKHDAMSIRKSVAPPSLSSSDPESEPPTPPQSEATEKPTLNDMREQEKSRDELIASLKDSGASEEHIQAVSDSMDSSWEDVPVQDTPASFPDSTEPVSEKEMTDEFLTSLREAGMPEEQINAIAEAMPSAEETNVRP
jgi:hypothetical protein